jgi:hypothetical protein
MDKNNYSTHHFEEQFLNIGNSYIIWKIKGEIKCNSIYLMLLKELKKLIKIICP